MTAVYIIIAAVLTLSALLSARLRLVTEYSEDGYFMIVRIGILKFHVLPLKKKKPKREKRKSKDYDQPAKGPKRGGNADLLKAYLPGIFDLLSGLRKRLCIDDLTVWYMSAGEDPAEAAQTFGRASAALGILTGSLERVLIIKNRDFRTSISFEETKPRVYLKAAASMRVGQALSLVIRLAYYIILHRPGKKVK